jgi:hypothetical protein
MFKVGFCGQCGRVFRLADSHRKLIHRSFEQFCCVECSIGFIKDSPVLPELVTVPLPRGFRRALSRSSYEVAWAEMFKRSGIEVVYEPFSIRLDDGRRYIPDFLVVKNNLLIECKGSWAIGAKSKLSEVFKKVGDQLLLLPTHLCREAVRRVGVA